MHALTWRVKSHVSVDGQAYRDPADIAAARATDPLLRARALALQGEVPVIDMGHKEMWGLQGEVDDHRLKPPRSGSPCGRWRNGRAGRARSNAPGRRPSNLRCPAAPPVPPPSAIVRKQTINLRMGWG